MSQFFINNMFPWKLFLGDVMRELEMDQIVIFEKSNFEILFFVWFFFHSFIVLFLLSENGKSFSICHGSKSNCRCSEHHFRCNGHVCIVTKISIHGNNSFSHARIVLVVAKMIPSWRKYFHYSKKLVFTVPLIFTLRRKRFCIMY